jgi:hypothetical protein
VAITLRNLATGAEITAKTSHGGRYSFRDLEQGEYTLATSGPGGKGAVGGITVSPGHESHVQAVIDFDQPVSAEEATRHRIFVAEPMRDARTASETSNLLNRMEKVSPPGSIHAPIAEASVGAVQIAALPLRHRECGLC